jgi:hypothetical protein
MRVIAEGPAFDHIMRSDPMPVPLVTVPEAAFVEAG